jgi:MFS transporter, YNFM family, putative membrane transport protein
MTGEPVPRATGSDMAGFLLGVAGMFAAMYSTQAILPRLAEDFHVRPSEAGLTISVVVVAVAAGGWLWGPVSDRYGRRRTLMLACGMLVLPTLGAAFAPSFAALLIVRLLQGACMPGLLTVGVPYVAEVFAPALGGRAMGFYVGALVAGGLIGRVGVGLISALAGWRVALGLLALLPLAAVLVMRSLLPEGPPPSRSQAGLRSVAAHLRDPRVMAPAAAGAALFFSFVGVFSYITFRLERPPFSYGPAITSLVFVLWALGASGPAAGMLADRLGWRRVLFGAMGLCLGGILLTLPPLPGTVVLGLALVTGGMFGGVTAAQLGLSAAGEQDRGVVSAIYFTCYYLAGGLAGFLPGLSWQEWRWPGVALGAAAVVGVGMLTVAALCRRADRGVGARTSRHPD